MNSETRKLIGMKALFKVKIRSTRVFFRVPVRIVDARSAYGRTEVKVQADGGNVQAWVNRNHVEILAG